MAIVYTFPKVAGSDLVANDLLLLSKMNQAGRPTRSVRLEDLANYIAPAVVPIIGGPFLPLTAGSTVPLTGDLYLAPTGVGPSVGSRNLVFRGVDDLGTELDGARIFTTDSIINPSGQDLFFQTADDAGTLRTGLYIDAFQQIAIAKSPATAQLDVGGSLNIDGIALFQNRLALEDATNSNQGLRFTHPAGALSGVVNMYYDGVNQFARFVISRNATGGAEIEIENTGDINLNRTGNGNLLVGGEVTFDDYGSGSVTGTATYNLAVDSTGKVIEQPLSITLINGLINNLASAGSGGYDFMEWVSNVTSTTQIPVMKTPRNITLKSMSYSWMGDTPLVIGAGEQIEFTMGTIPSGVNPIIANYTASAFLFDLTSADNGTYANDVITGFSIPFSAGDVIAVVGQETGSITPNTGELSLSFEFEIS
tara:strand:- start:61 stop:1329 length:1269 start_codon:yes stop_codon:yes gene_type:complete